LIRRLLRPVFGWQFMTTTWGHSCEDFSHTLFFGLCMLTGFLSAWVGENSVENDNRFASFFVGNAPNDNRYYCDSRQWVTIVFAFLQKNLLKNREKTYGIPRK
jgi:hypothetical protein